MPDYIKSGKYYYRKKNKCFICMFSNKISLRTDKGSIKFINKCFL